MSLQGWGVYHAAVVARTRRLKRGIPEGNGRYICSVLEDCRSALGSVDWHASYTKARG